MTSDADDEEDGVGSTGVWLPLLVGDDKECFGGGELIVCGLLFLLRWELRHERGEKEKNVNFQRKKKDARLKCKLGWQYKYSGRGRNARFNRNVMAIIY